MRFGSPPSVRIASRMAARSTTHGTPVKSCSSTRLVRNAISFSTFAFTSHRASASTSARFTNASSSLRSRFSSRIFRLNGSRSTELPGSDATLARRNVVYCRPATFSVARLPKVFGCVMGSSLAVRPVVWDRGARDHGATAAPPSGHDRLSAIYRLSERVAACCEQLLAVCRWLPAWAALSELVLPAAAGEKHDWGQSRAGPFRCSYALQRKGPVRL